MNASLAIQILPKVQGDEEVCRVVDEVIAYMQSTGLHCFVGPCETAVEGDFDTIMEIAKQCHLVAIKAGAPSVSWSLKISYRPEGEVLTIDRHPSITSKLAPAVLIAVLLAVWPALFRSGSGAQIHAALSHGCSNRLCGGFPPALMTHARVSLSEAFLGLGTAVILSFVVAFLMDQFRVVREAVYPLLILTQTVPTVAIAPLLVLWLGYGILPKVVLIVITCFFPMTIGLLSGFASADPDFIHMMRAMGASGWQIFRYVKLPSSAEQFFSGLRISASYSVVGAVISEWLGGFEGLGVYMMRVKKSYAFDKMFAVIFLISIISLILIKAVDLLKKKSMPWTLIHSGEH